MEISRSTGEVSSAADAELGRGLSAPVLELVHVSKTYTAQSEATVAIRDVSLSIHAGGFVALVGRSGCGKSTLLNLCGAMDFPTSGEIRVNGRSTTGLSDEELTKLRREKVGFIFQSFQLIHTLSAVENVELPLLLARRPDARRIALERLRWVDMESLSGRLPHQLSGGQQQRVAIARALVHLPPILLADEPTGNLDSATGDLVLELLRRTAKEFGVCIVMATHSADGAQMTDRVIAMKDGRIDNQ